MVERLGLPLMLKPDQGGSALGAQVVTDAADLPAAMVSCLAYADTVLAERFVDGIEVAVSVVEDGDEPRALPPVEVEAKGGVYDYTARYTPGATTFHCPARLDDGVLATLRETALAAHRLLGLRDVSRMDAVVDADGRVQILEVNVSPGPDGARRCCRWRRRPRARTWVSCSRGSWSGRWPEADCFTWNIARVPRETSGVPEHAGQPPVENAAVAHETSSSSGDANLRTPVELGEQDGGSRRQAPPRVPRETSREDSERPNRQAARRAGKAGRREPATSTAAGST